MPQRSDQALLADMDQGAVEVARDALRVLYERHAEAVFSFLCRLTTDMNIAEDILQESFLVVSRNPERFREGSARPWLLSIAASRLRLALRTDRRRRRREGEAAQCGATTSEPVIADGELEQAMHELPATERAALDLRYVSGLSVRETATVLGVSERTAKSWTAAGLKRLRVALDISGETS